MVDMAFKTDIEIAREAKKKPIQEIGDRLGIPSEHLLPYGHDKAKVSQDFIGSLSGRKDGKLILDVLSHEERLSFRDLERRLEQVETVVPPVVRDYLFSRLKPAHAEARPNFLTRLKRFFGLEKPMATRLNAELETIVKFLEDQLEV